MRLEQLSLAFSGPDLITIAQHLWRLGLWGDVAAPREVRVNQEDVPVTADWIERYSGAGQTIAAFLDNRRTYDLIIHKDGVVHATFDFTGGPSDLPGFLNSVPFEVASFGTRHSEWLDDPDPYYAAGFGNHHLPHGWACAFKGDGHRNLVSRRWLVTGPWRVLQGPDDTTLVQFHDLGLDAEAALEQALPAHEHMGISPQGGYLQTPYVYRHELKGLYDENRHVLKIVVLGRTVSAVEMRDACAARRDNALGPDRPIDNVAFIFPDPEEARAHLPRLWPYELECWTIIDGFETRLDTDQPPEQTSA
ncbi:hypothetical protein ACFOVU_10025 [Nocardiopsis sediminis]|uniref:Uncharacterized protein n=1 Tax=Nocardiopsis sediminis TaxID=1778267 RepID=A0ABV8FMQ4_9ACTN